MDTLLSQTAPDGTAYDLHLPVTDAQASNGSDDAPCIALIHGLGLSRDIWQPLLAQFTPHYRVLNYDLYGHGDSAVAPEPASLTVFSNQLANLMEHTGIAKAAIVGFSIGGMINRRFAMDHAEKTSSLVILNSPHDRGEDAQQQVEARAAQVRDQGAMATLDDALKRWFTPDYLADGPAINTVRQWRAQVDAEGYAQAAWVLANGVRELINPVQKIQCPALVVTCENDTGSTVKMSHDIAAEIDNSSVMIVPRLQHLGLMQEPQLFSRAIRDFLQNTQPNITNSQRTTHTDNAGSAH